MRPSAGLLQPANKNLCGSVFKTFVPFELPSAWLQPGFNIIIAYDMQRQCFWVQLYGVVS